MPEFRNAFTYTNIIHLKFNKFYRFDKPFFTLTLWIGCKKNNFKIDPLYSGTTVGTFFILDV